MEKSGNSLKSQICILNTKTKSNVLESRYLKKEKSQLCDDIEDIDDKSDDIGRL